MWRIIDMPEKTTNVVSTDYMIVQDSQDSNIIKKIEATKFKWDQGEQWIQWPPWLDGSSSANWVYVDVSAFDNNLSSADDTVQKALNTLDELISWWWEASWVTVDASVFTKNLSSTDVDVQTALATIDQLSVSVQTSTTYTTSNVTSNRTLDADSYTTDDLADVLSTLIEDLKAAWIIPN